MSSETLLYRQVHPNFIDSNQISAQVFGQITSVVFKPTPKDNDLLSVYNSQCFEPEAAHLHYTNESKLASRGVAAVSCEECVSQNLEVIKDNHAFALDIVPLILLEKRQIRRIKRQKDLKAMPSKEAQTAQDFFLT